MAGRKFQSQETETNYYIKHLGRFGLSMKNFQQSNSPYDVAWNYCNELIIQLSTKKEWHDLSQLYHTMAIISDETNRRSPVELLKQASYWQLMGMKHQSAGLEYVAKISATSESCEACKSQDGQVFTLDEALEKMPLPHKDCTYQLFNHPGFCRCEYLFELKETTRSPKSEAQLISTAKPAHPWSRRTINIILIAIPAICLVCFACNWALQTFFPTAAVTISTNVPIPTQTISPTTSPAEKYVAEYGGTLAAYNEIFVLTDCKTLQEKFETAYANNQRETPGTPLFKVTLGYMLATDDHMKSIGCY